MPSKDGWTHERDHEKVTLGKKVYRNMEEYSRPCAVCAEKFSIFVRANNSGVVNSSFGLKTCKEHRGQAIGGGVVVINNERIAELEVELKEAQDSAAAVAVQAAGIRKAVHEQLGLSLIGDAINYDSVTAGIQALKANYELGPALKSAALYGLGVTRTLMNGDDVKTAHEKMPWE